jgi:hypothetical protein
MSRKIMHKNFNLDILYGVEKCIGWTKKYPHLMGYRKAIPTKWGCLCIGQKIPPLDGVPQGNSNKMGVFMYRPKNTPT